MRFLSPPRLLALVLGVATVALPAAHAQALLTSKYIVTDLGTLGGTRATAQGINAAGQVVGYSDLAGDAARRAFRTAANRPIRSTDDLGTLGGTNSFAYAINSGGQVVGDAETAMTGPFGSPVVRAFRADPGQAMFDLGTLAPNGGVNGVNDSGARAINDAAAVAGYATVPVNSCASVSWAFRTAANGVVAPLASGLGTLLPGPVCPNGRSSIAWGLNNFGMAVGRSATTLATGVPNHAFRYPGFGPMINIGTLGGRDSQAFAVNDRGEVVGESQMPVDPVNNPFNNPHAFIVSGQIGPFDLGTLGGTYSSALAINTRDPSVVESQVVGVASTTGDAAFHAFLWTGNASIGGTMIDLNSLIDATAGWELTMARGINSRGQIVADARRNGVFRAVRLDPADVAVEVLISRLSDAELGLTGGQAYSLGDKLEGALNSIRQRLAKQANNQLNAYLSAVDNYARNGKIGSATAQELRAAGLALLAILP